MQSLGEPLWFGSYRLTSRLATGGMAEVYVGRHISPEGQFGPMVAVKRLLPHLVKDSSIVRMFLNEARITAQIHHPNVVSIYELGQFEGEPFIAMELLEGRTWAELRTRAAEDGRRMPSGVALRILAEACRGLDAAHRAVDEEGKPLALVHRDFTPDNIHVGVKGDVKVIDFGIARTSAWGAGTEPGTLKGKFFYMSPEMITAKPVDHRADIFAAGVMLFEQLCGRRPFTGNSIDEVVIRIAREDPALPSTYDPAVPRPLEAICLRALAKDPRSRYQTLAEFVEALQAVGGDSVLAAPEEVGAYVTTLFPENTDERRSTLRRAREADPSIPGQHAPPSAALPPEEHEPAFARTVPSPIRAHVLVKPATAPQPPAPPPAQAKRRSLAPLVLGLAALVGLGAGGAFVALSSPSLTAQQQLALAEQAKDGARVDALQKLATLPDATDAELARAAELLAEAKAWEPLLGLVDAWLLKSPKSADARLYEARGALGARKAKRVESAVKEAVALAPNDGRAEAVLAQLREQQGDPNGALDAWSKVVAKAPGNTQALAKQGYWLSQLGKLDEAEAALAKANKKKPTPETTAELGFVKFRKEQRDEAIRLLRGVVKDAPGLLEGHYYLAAALFQKGDLAAARAEYLAADALAGTDTRPLVGLCEMEQMQQTPELAAAQQKLTERFPKESAALLSKCAAAAPAP